MRKGKWYLIVGMVVVSLLIIGSSTVGAQPAAKPPIKIGCILEFSGPVMDTGPRVRSGMELAFDHAGWEIAGRKVELTIEDSATNPATGMDKIRKLVERDKVEMLLGLHNSGVASAVMPYIEERKIPAIKVTEYPLALKQKYEWLFLPNGTAEQMTFKMGDYAYEDLGYRAITVMGPDLIAGRIFVGSFTDQFKKRGGKVIQEQWFPAGNMDFASYLVNLKQADACFVWGAGQAESVRLVQQYSDHGLLKKMPLMTYHVGSIIEEEILPQEGDACLGVCGPATWAPSIDTAANRKFVEEYKKKYGKRPPMLAHWGYACAATAIEALKATGGDTTPEKVRQAILNLKIDLPAGPLRFTPDGIGISSRHIVKNVKVNNEYLWQVVKTYDNVEPPPAVVP